jgi:hypothetical protein
VDGQRVLSLHDESYWFRVLNGHRVAGFDTVPVAGYKFETVGAIVERAGRAIVLQATVPQTADLRQADVAAPTSAPTALPAPTLGTHGGWFDSVLAMSVGWRVAGVW